MMTTHSPSLLRRCWKGLMTLLACGGIFGNLFVVGLVGAPLALVSPPAMAACTLTSGSLTQTYTYTAANINQAAALPFPDKWSCTNNGSRGNSGNICYESVFDGSAANGASTMAYTVGLGAPSIPSMTSGQVYGLYTTPVSGTTALPTTLTVTVPAGAATGAAVGTYSDSNIQFAFDEQGNDGACEANFVPSTANWDAIALTAHTANFVIPSLCTLVTQSQVIDFGNLPGGTAIPAGGTAATGTIAVQCNPGAAYSVYLGNGQNLSGGFRRMRRGTSGNYIPYQLYKSTNYTTSNIWSAPTSTNTVGSAEGVGGTGNGSNQNMTVYAQIPAGTAVPATTGLYQDTVVITVAY